MGSSNRLSRQDRIRRVLPSARKDQAIEGSWRVKFSSMISGKHFGSAALGGFYLSAAHGHGLLHDYGSRHGVALAVATLALAVGSAAVQSVTSQLGSKNNSRRALVLGADREAAQHSELFRTRRRGSSEIVGFVSGGKDGRLLLGDDDGEKPCESFESILDSRAIDEVLQVGQCPGLDGSQLPQICAVRGITLRTLV